MGLRRRPFGYPMAVQASEEGHLYTSRSTGILRASRAGTGSVLVKRDSQVDHPLNGRGATEPDRATETPPVDAIPGTTAKGIPIVQDPRSCQALHPSKDPIVLPIRQGCGSLR